MTTIIPSLDLHRFQPGRLVSCSWQRGWRSLLLRGYEEPPVVEEFVTPATADQLVVLVTAGTCDFQARHEGTQRHATKRIGHVGMTAAGHQPTRRWHSDDVHRTLHLHLPAATLHEVLQDLSDHDPLQFRMPALVHTDDPVIAQTILALERAIQAGAPDLYAEHAAQFLAVHLLTRHGGCSTPVAVGADELRLRRAEAFMRAHLDAPLSLAWIAREAGVSRFHLIRLFKRAHGETPVKRLTRLRMEAAQGHLAGSAKSVTEIAFLCGYDNPAHFASAFRRVVGVSPSDYRRAHG